jgi:hypothetical protein
MKNTIIAEQARSNHVIVSGLFSPAIVSIAADGFATLTLLLLIFH